MKLKLFLSIIFIIFLSFTLHNCKKETHEKPNYVGSWEGTTSDNKDIYFRVNDNNEIDSVKVYVTINSLEPGICDELYLHKTTKTAPAIIKDDGTFEVELQGIKILFFKIIFMENTTAKLIGKFNSELNCTGNFANIKIHTLICGGHPINSLELNISSFTWSANK